MQGGRNLRHAPPPTRTTAGTPYNRGEDPVPGLFLRLTEIADVRASHLPDDPALPALLAANGSALVACLCAEWCGTCREFRPAFDALAARMADYVFVWVDIEDFPAVTENDDVENFPTILIQVEEEVRFFGPIPPQVTHLERLIAATGKTASDAVPTPGPNLCRILREQAY